MNIYLKGLKEAAIPAILVVVVPTALLGFLLSHGNFINFFIKALPIVLIGDIGANIINNYSDWEIDIVNKKRETLHKVLNKKILLYIYFILLVLLILILHFSAANIYLWISSFSFVILGLLYSIFIRIKDRTIFNYVAIALSYAGISSIIGFFSGSSSATLFLNWLPLIGFLMLVDVGYSITKDYSDIIGDSLHKKKTLPVVVGKKKSLYIQLVIVTFAYMYLFVLIAYKIVPLAFSLLFISYGFALYILFKIYNTAETKIHEKMHHHSQHNGLLVRLIIIIILFII